jgi:hypothetical protein
MTKGEETEVGYALMALADAKVALSQKVYSVAKDRINTATRLLRVVLHAEGKDEKGK